MYDLLSAAEDMNKLKLYEDPMVRGSVIIHGLEDVIVTSKEQVQSAMIIMGQCCWMNKTTLSR